MSEDAVKQPRRLIGTPFPPGVSGNPNGRPKRLNSITTCVQELLNGDAEKIKDQWNKSGKKTGAQIAAIGIVSKLSKGDPAVLKEVWQRTEGRVPQRLEHTGAEGAAIITTRTIVKDYEAISGD